MKHLAITGFCLIISHVFGQTPLTVDENGYISKLGGIAPKQTSVGEIYVLNNDPKTFRDVQIKITDDGSPEANCVQKWGPSDNPIYVVWVMTIDDTGGLPLKESQVSTVEINYFYPNAGSPELIEALFKKIYDYRVQQLGDPREVNDGVYQWISFRGENASAYSLKIAPDHSAITEFLM